MISFFRNTVDKVIGDFSRTVQKLEQLAEFHMSESEFHAQKAGEHLKENSRHNDEASRAVKIADNINKLIQGV